MASMSRKHYREVASILATTRQVQITSEAANALTQVTAGLADMFAADNPNFDRDKFLSAANPPIAWLEFV